MCKVTVLATPRSVTCTENILSGGPAPEERRGSGPLVGQLVVATNVFRAHTRGLEAVVPPRLARSSRSPARTGKRTREHPPEWARGTGTNRGVRTGGPAGTRAVTTRLPGRNLSAGPPR